MSKIIKTMSQKSKAVVVEVVIAAVVLVVTIRMIDNDNINHIR